jgi:hypothetical protein
MDKKFADKYKDARWKEKRRRIIERDCGICADCYGVGLVHVHHLYYEYNKDPWDYPDDALITLCNECHEIEHNRFKQYVGPTRDLSLKKIGFRAKDYETLTFLLVGVAAGFMKKEEVARSVIDTIHKRQANYTRRKDTYRAEHNIPKTSEWI